MRTLLAKPRGEDVAKTVLRLTPEAMVTYSAFATRMLAERRNGTHSPLMAQWYAKAHGQGLRIAGILALLGKEDATEIGIEEVTAAIAWIDYFAAHTEAIIVGHGADDRTLYHAHRVVAWLKAQGEAWVSKNQIAQSLRCRDLPKMADWAPIFDVLEAKNYLRSSLAGCHRAGGGRPSPGYEVTVTLSDLVTRLEAHATISVRATTLRTYQFAWQAILRMIPPQTPLTAITTSTLLATIGKLQADGLSSESIRKHIAQIKKLCSYAVEEGLLIQDPSTSIKLPKVPKRMPRFLSPAERDRLLAVAEAKGRDYHLLVACGVYLGLRKAELNALSWASIDFEKKVAHVVNTDDFTTKSGKPRTIPVCEELLVILNRYRHVGGFVLAPRKRYRLKARYRWEFRDGFEEMVIAAKLDVRVISPHAMRHTFASILAQRGVSLFKIAAWMGHSTAQVTELYAHLTAYDDDIGRLNSPALAEKAVVQQPAVKPA